MGCEFGGEGLFDGLERGIGVAAVEVGENAADAAEELAGALEGEDGIFKRGGFGVACDGGDLGELLGHTEIEGGREMLVLDKIKRGIAQRKRAGGKERIGGRHLD